MTTTFLIPKNNATSHLTSSMTIGALTLTLVSGGGAFFPTTYPFHISIEDEILEVSDNTADVLTVTRNAESTSAATHAAGSVVDLNITAQAITDITGLFSAADVIPYATASGIGAGLTVAASRIVGKKASGTLSALTGAEVMAILSGQAGAAFSFNSQEITSAKLNASVAKGTWTTDGTWTIGGTVALTTVIQVSIGGFNTNTAFGYGSMANLVLDKGCSAFGKNALANNTTGEANNAFGIHSLLSNVDGGSNTAFGDTTLQANVSGDQNCAFGYQALYYSTGDNNSAFGEMALTNTTGNANTAFGRQALKSALAASNNTAVGVGALFTNTTGNTNIALGYFAGGYQATPSAMLFIDSLDRATEANELIKDLVVGQMSATLANQWIAFNGNSLLLAPGTAYSSGAGLFIGSNSTNNAIWTSTQGAGSTPLFIGNLQIATLTGTEELDNKTLDASVAKGTWTASGTWTIPAVTLGGNITINGKFLDAGAGTVQINTTGITQGLKVVCTNDDAAGPFITLDHVTASPAANDQIGAIVFSGRNSTPAQVNYATLYCESTVVTAAGETGYVYFYMKNAGVNNTALTLTGAGLLAVDVAGVGTPAQVDLFDAYDDALVLKQGIQQHNRELLADMGIFSRKSDGSGYMMKIQPMIRLLAGGIYQTRQMLEDTRSELNNRISEVEKKLALLTN